MREIPLTRNKVALVDDEDYERLAKHQWAWVPACSSESGSGYAVRKGNPKHGEPRTVQLHREVMLAKDNSIIDHINRNGLDNRKANLRFVTTQKNAFNRCKPVMPCTSKYKGVFQRKKQKSWTARIKFNGRTVELGCFRQETTAAAAYNFASRIFFGVYRRENDSVDELSLQDKKKIFSIARRYIEQYGWYVDTETYRSFYFDIE